MVDEPDCVIAFDRKQIIDRINDCFCSEDPTRDNGTVPAVDYEFIDGGGELGVIASVTEPFCPSCARDRLTASW